MRATIPALSQAWTGRMRVSWGGVVASGLLLIYAAMAFSVARTKGVSFDEGQQLAMGYNIWLNDDYRVEGANGDLIKRWATLPYLVTRPAFVGRDAEAWREARPYHLGRAFFFEVGNRPEELLEQGRAMVVVLGVVAGLLVFRAARGLFGTTGGLIALGLYVFCPHMLAFGGIVSTDMSVTLLLFASVGFVWRLLHEVTWQRVAVSVVVLGLLLLAKLSALVIVPITAVLVVVKLAAGGPLAVEWRARRWTLTGRGPQAAMVLALVLVHAVGGWTAIWAHYGFRHTASPSPDDPGVRLRPPPTQVEVAPVWAAAVNWSREAQFLPQGFRRGVSDLLGADDKLGAYLRGDWKLGGWREFFPYAIWVKTTPALLLLLPVGLMCWGWVQRRGGVPAAGDAGLAAPSVPTLYQLTPHVVLVGVFLAVAMTEDINLGHRHVLPIYPALYVLAGSAALAWSAPAGRILVALLLAWAVRDAVAIRPNYLAYFGAQAGGPEKGYTHLVDSSLDWGMELPALKRWLDTHNPDGKVPVSLAYFGTDEPEHHGIRAHRLPGFFDWRRPAAFAPLEPGYFAISASLWQGVYTASFGPWSREAERVYRTAWGNIEALSRTNPNSAERRALFAVIAPEAWTKEFYVCEHLRFARLCAWLRKQGAPPHHVGHSIYIWKLDRAALEAALLGPPVELSDRPLLLRQQ